MGRECPSTRRGAAGFTLLELLVALSILAAGLLAMLVMQAQSLKGGSRGRHTTTAAMLARDQVERIQRMPFSDSGLAVVGWTTPPWLDNSGDPSLAAGEIAVDVTQPGGAVSREQLYRVFYRVSAGPGGDANLRAVDLEVTWTEANLPLGPQPTRTGLPTVAVSTLLVNNDR